LSFAEYLSLSQMEALNWYCIAFVMDPKEDFENRSIKLRARK